jgi:hypothetical protein
MRVSIQLPLWSHQALADERGENVIRHCLCKVKAQNSSWHSRALGTKAVDLTRDCCFEVISVKQRRGSISGISDVLFRRLELRCL